VNGYEQMKDLQDQLDRLDDRFGREDREQLKGDISAVMKTPEGRRLVSSILGRGDVFGFVFHKSENDATRLAYFTGRREAAADIYSKVNAYAPEETLVMFQERNAIEQKRRKMRDEILSQIQQIKDKE